MQSPYFVLLDDATQRKAQLYEHLVQIDTYHVDELGGLQLKLQEKWAKQWHAVIWAPYDWGRELMGLGNSEEKGRADELRAAASKGTAIEVANTAQKGTELPTEHVPNNSSIQYLESTPQNPSSTIDKQLRIYWFSHKTELASEAAIQAWLAQHTDNNAPAGLATIQLAQDKESYIRCIEQIREDIAAGEMYQINYTTEFIFKAYGSPFKLYQKIRDRQRVPYGTLAHLPDVLTPPEELSSANKPTPSGTHTSLETLTASHARNLSPASQWTLSFSPELFLDIRQDGTIHTEPMKGTVPTADDGRNEERAAALRADPKNRAENVMIVDLLRNDLSKIAVPNGVHVPELFKVSNFGSVLQMTTPIQAMAKPETQVEDILQALFPCGSITGAPKKRSMQLIDQYEARPRGLYTGSIGFLEPCAGGLGFYGKLNVVIRTLQMRECVGEEPHKRIKTEPPMQDCTEQQERVDKSSLNTLAPHQFTGVMGVGSGIVYDSDPALEYEECHWKARFMRKLPLDFSLFETMRVDIEESLGQCRLLELHIQRLQRSANDLDFNFSLEHTRATIQAYIAQLAKDTRAELTSPTQTYRLKVSLQGDGTLSIQAAVLEPLKASAAHGEQTVLLADSALPSQDFLRRYKTTHRQFYDTQMHKAIAHGAFDTLCFNQDDILLEGARSSVFMYSQGQWLTPSLDLDILQSVMRADVLRNPEQWLTTYTPGYDAESVATAENTLAGKVVVHECHIQREQVLKAEQIIVVNALRGVVPVRVA